MKASVAIGKLLTILIMQIINPFTGEPLNFLGTDAKTKQVCHFSSLSLAG